eukprot:37720-Eustigmatos_ZCMA.PRE.1
MKRSFVSRPYAGVLHTLYPTSFHLSKNNYVAHEPPMRDTVRATSLPHTDPTNLIPERDSGSPLLRGKSWWPVRGLDATRAPVRQKATDVNGRVCTTACQE